MGHLLHILLYQIELFSFFCYPAMQITCLYLLYTFFTQHIVNWLTKLYISIHHTSIYIMLICKIPLFHETFTLFLFWQVYVCLTTLSHLPVSRSLPGNSDHKPTPTWPGGCWGVFSSLMIKLATKGTQVEGTWYCENYRI